MLSHTPARLCTIARVQSKLVHTEDVLSKGTAELKQAEKDARAEAAKVLDTGTGMPLYVAHEPAHELKQAGVSA